MPSSNTQSFTPDFTFEKNTAKTAERRSQKGLSGRPRPVRMQADTPFPFLNDAEPVASQQEYLLAWARQIVPYWEPLPQYDLQTASGTIYAGFLYTFGTGLSTEPQKLFGYLGVPNGASAQNRVPAMLLIHGGAGQAYSQWVEEWMRRGYAAITVDLYGDMPLEDGRYVFNFMDPPEQHAYRPTPTGMCHNGFDLAHPRDRITDQGMFHVIAANIMAGNLLRAADFTREGELGVTGISWGGLSTSILIGFDPRFSFAVPVYGSAYLDHTHTYFYDWYQDPDCTALWEAKHRLRNFTAPILWVNDAEDRAFSVNSTSLSFANSVQGTICLKRELEHYHKFDIEEVYAFAEQVLHGGEPLPVFTAVPKPEDGRKFTLTTNLRGICGAEARLYFITEPMSYRREGNQTPMNQTFQPVPPVSVAEDGTVPVRVPEEACAYFVELWRGDLMTSTPLVEFESLK